MGTTTNSTPASESEAVLSADGRNIEDAPPKHTSRDLTPLDGLKLGKTQELFLLHSRCHALQQWHEKEQAWADCFDKGACKPGQRELAASHCRILVKMVEFERSF